MEVVIDQHYKLSGYDMRIYRGKGSIVTKHIVHIDMKEKMKS